MIQVIKKAAYKHGYIIITAAWLYTISFLFTNYFSYSSSPKKVTAALEKYIKTQEEKFESLLKDSVKTKAIVSDRPAPIKETLQKEVFGIFCYTANSNGNLAETYWNNNTMSVSTPDIYRPDGYYFLNYQDGSFDYIKHTIQVKNKQYIMACLVPVHWTFFLERDSLQPGFQNFPELESKYVITTDPGAPVIRNSKGDELFRIKNRQNVSNDQPGTFSTLLRVLAVILLIVFINSIAGDIVPERGFIKALVFLVAVVVVLRILSYYYPVPFDFRQLTLFQPLDNIPFGSLNNSLGDMLINSVLLFWITSFTKFNRPAFFTKGLQPNKRLMLILTVLSVIVLLFMVYSLQDIISGIVSNSSIRFEVTNFFTIDYYIITSFVIVCLLMLSFYYLSHLLIKPLQRSQLGVYQKLVIIVTIGLVFITIRSFYQSAVINFIILFWFILYILILEYRKKDSATAIIESPFFLFWAIFFMASATALIAYRVNSMELVRRKTIAADYVIQTNRQTLELLNMSINGIDNSFFEDNFWRFDSSHENNLIKDSLINNNFSGYLSNYETHIYTYNANHEPLFNEDSTSYSVIKTVIQSKAKPTGVPFFYAYENTLGGYSYVYEKEVYGTDSVFKGSIFILANPRFYKKDAFFLGVFNSVRDLTSDINTNYSIAVYYKNRLIKTSNNDYGFVDTITDAQAPKFQDSVINAGGYSQLWYNAGTGKVVVVVKKSDWFVSAFTIFSYLFCLFIAVIILLHYSNLLFKTRFRYKDMQRVFSFNIRTQVQATIIAISIFSFLVIGGITISFFIISFNKDNETKLTNTAIVLRNEIEEDQKKSPSTDIQKQVKEIARLHNTDINYYDKNGNLEVSSIPYIYTKRVLSYKIHPAAFFALHYDHKIRFIQKEHIGSTVYLSSYVVVRDESDAVTAYLNVPSLNSQNELKLEINNFLVTLININALIFIFAGGIAILVTSRITSSFTLIGNKMRAISLGSINEEIAWTGKDEIGALVDEYNKMVRKLEQSAQALARSEREGAWREMARQVAHEIKNPLTPMKLSIQYLQRAISNNASNVKELSQQVANTLIEQIEQLSKIAGDFSQFANIGNVKIENFNISEVIASLVNLYSADSNLQITWNKGEGNYIINADKVQINRLFTNLIKNAIEASNANATGKVEITITQYTENNNVVVAIKDMGTGIPAEMQQKIFMPNFTTKSSGTGLGLAICHGIVEKANGHIWFETEVDKGSTFYVSLPLVG
ncbi:MAG TPA: HAMP domain-containing sensor histidine kinase [Chitinophagaceae bacterium]|nr:HAMP domain-containing sensor histidine kinase [Chitinophagaceae bacterium]